MLQVPHGGTRMLVQIPTEELWEDCKCSIHGTRSKFNFPEIVMMEAILITDKWMLISLTRVFGGNAPPESDELQIIQQPAFRFCLCCFMLWFETCRTPKFIHSVLMFCIEGIQEI